MTSFSSDWRVREFVGAKFGWRCVYCDRIVGRASLVVDHAWPLSRDGDDMVDNFAACCQRCNSQKGAMSFDEFLLARRIGCGDFNYYFPGIPQEIRGPRRDWLQLQSKEYRVTPDWENERLDGYEIENIAGKRIPMPHHNWRGID